MPKISIYNIFSSLSKDFKLSYAATILGIIVAGLFFIKFSLNEENSKIEKRLAESSKQIEKIIISDLDYIKYQILYTSRQIKILGSENKKIEKLLSTFTTEINNQVDVAITWNSFSWVDIEDRMIVDGAAGIIPHPINVSGRDYLKITKVNPGQLTFGQTVNGALSQRPIVPAGVGVFSDKNTYLGTLVFGFDIERILGKIEKEIGNETISFAVLRDDEMAFSSNNFDKTNESIIVKNKKNYDEDDHSKIISSQGIFSKRAPFAYYKKIKNYPLTVVAFYDKNLSYQQLTNILLKQSLFLGLITLFFIILFKQIYRRVVNPIFNLSQLAIKTSNKDFSFQIEKPSGQELTELYNALLLLKESFKREEDLIQKLKIANQKISTENFNKSEFLAAISHDIRNPISAIKSFLYLIRTSDHMPPEEITELAQDVENCANEVLEFISDLMDVNQVASGEFSIDLSKEIDIANIIRRSIRVNRDFARKRKIEIVGKIDDDVPYIKLDARRVKQILVNLISNSIKYSRADTEVKVYLHKIFEGSKEKMQIIVEDQGFGMTPDQIKIALQKYGTIQNENSGRVDSFGLGLPLVKKLVELQNGIMDIDSKIGVGTKVILTFEF